MKAARFLFNHCQSPPNFRHHQIVVSITLCYPERKVIKYTWMPCPIYQNLVNLFVSVSIRGCLSKFMNVTTWEHCVLTVRFLDVANFTALSPLSLLISCKFSFPIVGLKISPLPTLTLKFPNKMFIWYLENLWNSHSSSYKDIMHIIMRNVKVMIKIKLIYWNAWQQLETNYRQTLEQEDTVIKINEQTRTKIKRNIQYN
jgi:hypothetical protein